MNKINYSHDEITKLWNAYAEKREIGLKKEANKLLENLITYLNNIDKDIREDFVNHICSLKFEEDVDITFQQPLVTKVLIPVLIPSIEMKIMPQLRWLYLISQNNISYIKVIEKEMGGYSPEALLKLANQINPNDLKTVKLLINLYIQELEFGCHHIPDGILIDKDEFDYIKYEGYNLISRYQNTDVVNEKVLKVFNYYNELYNDWFNNHTN